MQTLSRQDAADRSQVFRIATGNSMEELQEFIGAAGDINTTTYDGNTLLHCACYNPSPGAVRFLLEQGVGVDTRNRWGETALHIACRLGHERVSFVLLEYSADINARDGSGRTPLTWACRSGSPDTVNLLLSRGADPGISDEYGSTPAEYAAALGPDKTRRAEIVGTFFRYGFGVKRVVMTPETSGISTGEPADNPATELPALS
jgi:ankyrin repeat protein